MSMILRKPYAFFIKYFKLIHLIMAVLMGILVGQTNSFLTFFNQYINSDMLVIGRDLVSEIFFSFVYIYIVLVIVMDVIVWILLDFKNKKKMFYVFAFFCYVLLLVLYIYIRSIFVSMGEEVVDIRLIMVLRDFTIIAFVIQVLTLFITITRAIGFNLQQFDFESDLKDLNISSADNEEFEINVDLDSEKVKRSVKTILRNYRYYLKENLRIVIPIVLAVIITLGFFIYRNIFGNVTRYKEGATFNVTDYSIKVEDSFLTAKDYRLSAVEDGKTLVVLKLGIKTTNKTAQFSFGKFALQIGDNKYYHTIVYSDALKDIGNTYIKQKLTSEYTSYLLVYEIPSSLANKDKKIVYIKNMASGIFGQDEKIEVELNPTNLDLEQQQINLNLNEQVKVDNFLLEDTTLTLKEVSIANTFNIDYRYCVVTNDCYKFYEPLQASFYGSYDKSLIKINLELSGSSSLSKDVSKFITMYGALSYQINGINRMVYLQNEKKPSRVPSDAHYYEIPKDVLSAQNIYLKVQLRGQNYVYTIK